MVEDENQAGDEQDGSLLSLARAIEEERARQGLKSGRDRHPEAVIRHRRARARREANPGSLLDALAAGPRSRAAPDLAASEATAREQAEIATSLAEIKDGIRQLRDAVRELVASNRHRRYF